MLNDNTVNSNYESDADIKEYEVSTQKYEALKIALLIYWQPATT